MKECAWCGRENEDDAVQCRECGTAEFKGDVESVNEPEVEQVYLDPIPDTSPFEENVLCISCLFPNPPERAFCKRCGGPIGFISTIGPYERCLAEGFIYRRAVQGRPKFIVMLGIWIIFFPAFLVGLLAIPVSLIYGGYEGMFYFSAGIGAVIISSIILFKVTRNYFTIPPKQSG